MDQGQHLGGGSPVVRVGPRGQSEGAYLSEPAPGTICCHPAHPPQHPLLTPHPWMGDGGRAYTGCVAGGTEPANSPWTPPSCHQCLKGCLQTPELPGRNTL